MPLPALSLELRHGRALSVAAVAEALALSCSLAQETLNPCHALCAELKGGGRRRAFWRGADVCLQRGSPWKMRAAVYKA